MKKLLAPFFVSSGILAAGDVTLYFPPQKMALPPLTLADIAKQSTPLTIVGGLPVSVDRHEQPQSHTTPKIVSNMPVIVPKEGIDSKITKVPDSGVDFKLIIKDPAVAPPK